MATVYFYTLYERIWHWLQAALILLLVLTGLEVHLPGTVRVFGFAGAINVHNVLGFILIGNAFLAFFYHLSTGKIRQYLPEPKDFVSLAIKQALYYARGIFRGEPHPVEKDPDRKLNPLQKITYLAILNILLPLQMITGLLIWGAQRWPGAVQAVGGLRPLAFVHSVGAWIFFAFVVMHIYLTTTGRTPLSNMKEMIFGWGETHGK